MRTVDSSRCRQLLPSNGSTVAQITAFIRGEWCDEQASDSTVWRSISRGVMVRATEVNRIANVRRRRQLLGAVAVSAAAKEADRPGV